MTSIRVMLAAVALSAGFSFAETPATQPAMSAIPATQPASAVSAPVSMADVEMRANLAFAAGDYKTALPLLTQVLNANKNASVEKIGPIQEMIRVAQKNLATANAQQNAVVPDAAAAPAAPGSAIDPSTNEPRKIHPAVAAGTVQDMAIKELGNFAYDSDKGGGIPADVMAMNGTIVRLHGFMIPMDQAERITKFALVPSLFACCYGQPPQIQHTIVVDCPAGKAVSYFADEISVEGKLTVQEKKEDDIIVSIFEIQASSVKPLAK